MKALAIRADDGCDWLNVRQRTPEHKLMLAILELGIADAVQCNSIYGYGSESIKRRTNASALDWFTTTSEDRWIFSFANVCEALFDDSDAARDMILRWILKARAENKKFNRRFFAKNKLA